MMAADVVVLVAAVVACVAALVGVAAAAILVGQVRRLERGIEALRSDAVPLVHEAREAVGLASSEMARVEAVLEDTESVTATVDAASETRPADVHESRGQGPAFRAGTVGGLRRLRQPADSARPSAERRANGGRPS